jgi:glucose 1-dehydrogenase
MKAISIKPQTTDVSLVDIVEPTINSPDEIKLKVLQVGICGTDREEVSGGRADAPPGKLQLVIGHEMFGQVVETGTGVHSVSVGDYGVIMVRRECGECKACMSGRSDMCYTGNYTERGIKGADGFQAEYVVDKEKYIVKVPAGLKEIGVLTEPMSIVSKAFDEALIIQKSRLKFDRKENWLEGKKAFVAGIGAVGLMAAFALRLRGAVVVGMDIVDEQSLRPQILRQIGGEYLNGRNLAVNDIDKVCGEFDFIFEATGIPKLQFNLIDALAVNGIYIISGIPSSTSSINIPAAELLQQIVLKNQVILGSVNASYDHYKMAVDDLGQILDKWPAAINAVITEKIPFSNFEKALSHHSLDEIKVVVQW